MRTETRKERYAAKAGKVWPVSLAATNFSFDGNIAFAMRALACFGGKNMHIIGRIPKENELVRLSGGQSRLVKLIHHKNPRDFVAWCKENDTLIIAADLLDHAVSIQKFTFPSKEVVIVVGNEMDGLPMDITLASDYTVFVPMPGFGYCMNTSQTANVLLYEYARQKGF